MDLSIQQRPTNGRCDRFEMVAWDTLVVLTAIDEIRDNFQRAEELQKQGRQEVRDEMEDKCLC